MTLPGQFFLLDKALEGRTNLIAGADKEDYHVKNITPGKDFQPTAYADFAVGVVSALPNCGATSVWTWPSKSETFSS